MHFDGGQRPLVGVTLILHMPVFWNEASGSDFWLTKLHPRLLCRYATYSCFPLSACVGIASFEA